MEADAKLPERPKEEKKTANAQKTPKAPKPAKNPKAAVQNAQKQMLPKVPIAPPALNDPGSMFKEGFLKNVFTEKPSKPVITR